MNKTILVLFWVMVSGFCQGQVPILPSGMEMVEVVGGSFLRGCDTTRHDCYRAELPQHRVSVSTFWIAHTEVTYGQYAEFLNARKPTRAELESWVAWGNKNLYLLRQNDGVWVVLKGYDNHPIVLVSIEGALAFCTYYGGTLPSEAQWEYAAIGGKQSQNYLYAGSSDVEQVAWYRENANDKAQAVAQKKPNELGLYDMSGNVWEWCLDYFDEDFYRTPQARKANPLHTKENYSKHRVVRGGSWNSFDGYCRSITRFYAAEDNKNSYLGFRMVKK
ncbi:formylglycine-generating enzyme family protein [Hugenholtzia roseola]|uniref:formylglycine-generating enzyme family protein n=1 Tax=Hugenholtzia roseola TaxID=1002 RepID=UPI0003F94596|nr:SUMF1/EgtB/PvdO family nonheme iron enzyme [Hugenholtzia roseola]